MPSKKKPPVSTNHSQVNHTPVNSKPVQEPVKTEPAKTETVEKATPKAKINRVGSKVTYRAAVQQDGKWVDGPGEMDRLGYVISWGQKWVTILNLDAKKIEYAVLSSARLDDVA